MRIVVLIAGLSPGLAACTKTKATLTYSSSSMRPSIEKGVELELVEAKRLTYGDIVAFYPAQFPETLFVMRVVGLAGDRVEVAHNRLIVNGVQASSEAETVRLPDMECRRTIDFKVFRESVGRHQWTAMSHVRPGDLANMAPVTLGDGRLFVMGDSRDESQDSRRLGPLRRDAIVGRVKRSSGGETCPPGVPDLQAGRARDHDEPGRETPVHTHVDSLEQSSWVPPDYPEAAVGSNFGPVSCSVEVTLDTNGHVTDAEAQASCSPWFRPNAEAAVRQWTWYPPVERGEPVRATFRVNVDFPGQARPR